MRKFLVPLVLLIACSCSQTPTMTVTKKSSSPSKSPSPTPVASESVAVEVSATPSLAPETSPTPSAAVETSPSPEASPTESPSPTPSPTPSSEATATPTPEPTPTPTPVVENPVTFATGLTTPAGLAVDNLGNLYLADPGSQLIRGVTTAGTVTAIAGSGLLGFGNGTVETATFNAPAGVVLGVDGAIYVSDTGNHAIRKLASATGATTLVGAGVAGFVNGARDSARFSSPGGIAATLNGELIVADTGNQAIRQVSSSGDVLTLAGTGTAGYYDGLLSAAQFSSPRDVAVGATGVIYVADTGNNAIRKIDLVAGLVGTLATGFDAPTGLAVDPAGNVYVADTGNNVVKRVAADGAVTTLAGVFVAPRDVVVGVDGGVYVTDAGRVARLAL